MIWANAQLLNVSMPINDVYKDEADGLISVVSCNPTAPCSCVTTEVINGWRFMASNVVQTYIPQPPSCEHLDLLEHRSLVN